jgi:NADH dehydrogenase
VETASNISRYLNKHKISKKVIIIENSSSILGPLPQWMKNYCLDNLKRLKVEILTGVSVQKVEANKIILSNNQEFNKAMLIWAAGVKTADFLNKVNAEKTLQGRIKVDKFLRLNDYCFVIGDAAGFLEEGKYLRMAVQFSLKESDSVFVNLINSIYGLPLYAFKPRDLGYIIPMANNRSCGVILGFKFKGVIPTIMHFLMCIYRSVGLKNKFGLILDLLK